MRRQGTDALRMTSTATRPIRATVDPPSFHL
jgi:hypothetical protein